MSSGDDLLRLWFESLGSIHKESVKVHSVPDPAADYGIPGWLTGEELCIRWKTDLSELPATILERGLPLWIKHPGGAVPCWIADPWGVLDIILKSITQICQDAQKKLSFLDNDSRDGVVRSAVLSLCFFRMVDVTMCEKMNSAPRGDSARYWMTRDDILNRWNFLRKKTERLIPLDFERLRQLNAWAQYYLHSNVAVFGKFTSDLSDGFFRKSHIQEFEEGLLDAYEKGKLNPAKDTLGFSQIQLASLLWHDLAYKWIEDHGPLPEYVILRGIRGHKWGAYSDRDQTIRDALKDIPEIVRKRGKPKESITYDLT